MQPTLKIVLCAIVLNRAKIVRPQHADLQTQTVTLHNCTLFLLLIGARKNKNIKASRNGVYISISVRYVACVCARVRVPPCPPGLCARKNCAEVPLCTTARIPEIPSSGGARGSEKRPWKALLKCSQLVDKSLL